MGPISQEEPTLTKRTPTDIIQRLFHYKFVEEFMKYTSKWPTGTTQYPSDYYTSDIPKENLTSSKISPYKPSTMTYSKHPTYAGTPESTFTPKPLKSFLERSCRVPENGTRSINVTPEKERNRKQLSFILPYEGSSNFSARNMQADRSQQVFKNKDLNNASASTAKSSLRQTLSNQNSWQFQSISSQNKGSIYDQIILKKKGDSQIEVKKDMKSKFASRQHSRNNSRFDEPIVIEVTSYTERAQDKSKTPTKTPRVSQDLVKNATQKQRNHTSQTEQQGNYSSLSKPKRTSNIKPMELRIEDFQLGACKGEGRFGKVFPAIHKKSGFLLAIKKVAKESIRLMIEQFVQEVKISLFLNHPNIVRMYGFFCDSDSIYIMMQYMEEGSLFHQVRVARKFTEEQAGVKLLEVCEAVRYLHSIDILHRDIKPENIVISNGVCKLCDFGWAAYSRDRRNTYCGTLDYVCPEILEGESYDNFVDVWAIGVLAYELLVGKAPFYHVSRKETMRNIMNCDFSFPSDLSLPAKLFITKALQKNPDQRFNIESLLKDKFLTQFRQEL